MLKAGLSENVLYFVINFLALVTGLLPYSSTISPAKRDSIYRPERADQENQN
jgi:hypothetical protein